MDSRLEERYIVIKHKDLKDLERNHLEDYLWDHGISTIDCVVIEEDWPEYKPTVDLLVERVSSE